LNKPYGLKFGVIANVLTVVVGMVAVGIAVTDHVTSPVSGGSAPGKETPLALIGTRAAPVAGVGYEKAGRTLLLFLATTKEDCNEGVPLLKELTSALDARPESFQVVALFSDERGVVEEHLRRWQWPVEFRAGTKPADYGVDVLPSILMVNRDGLIEKRWRGQLSSAQGADIMKALGVWTPREPSRPAPAKADVKLYDEKRALLTVELPALLSGTARGLARSGDPTYREIRTFGVDGKGNVYFNYQEHIVKVDHAGKMLKSAPMPKGFVSGYCVDEQGNSYLYRQTKVVEVWSPDLQPTGTVSLENALGSSSPFVAKMAADQKNRQLYVQTYDPELREEALHRVDLHSQESKIIHQLRDAPNAIPSYGPGIFDWDIGEGMLYVSDPKEYRITTYSLKDGALLDTFSRPFEARAINPEDARLRSIGRDLPYILKPGAMNTLPAIWKITAAGDGKLLVFTSLRDAGHRQVVHIYGRGFRFLGTGLKHFRPGVNNHLVSGKLIFVADCGGDGELSPPGEVSPLDAPSLATRLKVFRLELD
jgi:hypothetical protein